MVMSIGRPYFSIGRIRRSLVGVAFPDRRREEGSMPKLIRMDRTGHTTVAEWTAGDEEAVERAVVAFRAELDRGYLAMVSTGPGHAEQVRELPVDADTVILRLPISGG
jgi:hypothetical protein